MVITEYGVGIGGTLENTHYAGMFVAESAVRANKYPTNIKYMGGYRIYQGLVSTTYDRTMRRRTCTSAA